MVDKVMDVRIPSSMTERTEIMFDGVLNVGTGVNVQEVIDAFCDFMDGESVHDLISNYGLTEAQAQRRHNMFQDLKGLWKHEDGSYVLAKHRNERLQEAGK